MSRSISFLNSGAALVFLLLWSGCAEDTIQPHTQVYGTIRSPFTETHPEARVEARNRSGVFSVAYADERGRYWLDLTPGDWRIVGRLKGVNWGSATPEDPYPLRVEAGMAPFRLNFDFSSITVVAEVPDQPEGKRVLVTFGSQDAQRSTLVRNGRVEVLLDPVIPEDGSVVIRHVGAVSSSESGEASTYTALPGRHTRVWGTTVAFRTIAGTVRSIPGIYLHLVGRTPDGEVMGTFQGQADEDGRLEYEISLPSDEPVLLATSVDGRDVEFPIDEPPKLYSLSPGEIRSDVELHLGGLRLDIPAPEWEHDFRVTTKLYDEGGALLKTIPSGELGGFPLLEPGAYLVQVEHFGGQCFTRWSPQWYPGVNDFESAQTIEIPNRTAVVPVSLDLVEGGTVQCRVRREDGRPSPAFDIVLLGTHDQATPCAYNSTYTFYGVVPGQYRIELIRESYDPVWYPPHKDSYIEVAAGESVAEIDIIVPW